MIIGIGTDLVEIERIRKACLREAFLVCCFTEKEREGISGFSVKLAGNFAVKEAVAKVFGTGFRGFRPGDIEVLRDEWGKPYVNLYRGAKKEAEKLGVRKIFVSITNTKQFAAAFAVGEGGEEGCSI